MSEVDLRVEDGIATVTMNRPDRLNAMNPAMREQLVAVFDETDADDAVRVVVVTGAGRGFCAGADVSAGGDAFAYEPDDVRLRDGGGRIVLRMFASLKPVIAAINGPAVGFGASFILPMDFRLASTTARFGFVAAARGIVPDAVSSWFLPKIVGVPTALDWSLTARLFDADEAMSRGLVRSIHEPDALLDAAYELGHRIAAAAAPVSAAVTRRLIWRMAGSDHPMHTHRIDSAAITALGRTADAAEGVNAWREKRAPDWALSPWTDLPDLPWPAEPRFEDRAGTEQRDPD
ncbi:enoyl-CoA hydratase-related protein [Agromyces aerolatus]|uniref:enoyl-CoA hydratase-related protein n=1 Tax=Agromyces sp. LY-1074 TaxID=3074080 RepID=UPI002861A46A|nr:MULTISPECIES: enoyl-CoA hydratase-related protein [unclassified Agromyces]MDR5699116.1 enoyl-CoA hydratase-related protein [Agromyces sp. LY-1074]MDR5705105.1 enoyl-CoA hydratase-related protein [Agromyces sp. LY-1358]